MKNHMYNNVTKKLIVSLLIPIWFERFEVPANNLLNAFQKKNAVTLFEIIS